MPDARAKLLIVDDEISIRTSLSQIFSTLGYCVRSAADGFTALSDIRQEIPDIIISDLNMPGMSGFEFLSVVRDQLPAVHLIAMSGAFSGTCLPSGVAADAFFEKGSGPALLIKTVDAMTQPGPHSHRDSGAWRTLRGFHLLARFHSRRLRQYPR